MQTKIAASLLHKKYDITAGTSTTLRNELKLCHTLAFHKTNKLDNTIINMIRVVYFYFSCAQPLLAEVCTRGPTLTEISYALPEIDFEIMKSEALEIRNHFLFKIYSVKSRKLLDTSRDHK